MEAKIEQSEEADEKVYELLDQQDEFPFINIVLPNEPQSQNAVTANVPLFIKKLWKMVNDDHAEDIISWNKNGDGFIIHDQLQFVSKLLPKYFKHNQLSSFVRQLNLYDFHKVQNIDKDEFQFLHPFFLQGVQQLLPLIKRKNPTGRHKAQNNESESSEISEIMHIIEDVKNKNDGITNEMTKLRQENAALWGEMNSLRVKYSKQTKIINKLIHFLIAYMQKHHNVRKHGRTVSTSNSNKYLKTGPKIMELDYRYKNNPSEFWTDFDNQQGNTEQQAYIVVEPESMDTDGQNSEKNPSTVPSDIEELLPGGSTLGEPSSSSDRDTMPQIEQLSSQPSSSKDKNSALQPTGSSKDNLGYFIDNSQIELNSIKELLKNLSSDDMANFYKLVNENYKNQNTEEEDIAESELLALSQLSPLANFSVDNAQDKSTIEHTPNSQLTSENVLNTDDLLNNVSVDQYFNMD